MRPQNTSSLWLFKLFPQLFFNKINKIFHQSLSDFFIADVNWMLPLAVGALLILVAVGIFWIWKKQRKTDQEGKCCICKWKVLFV